MKKFGNFLIRFQDVLMVVMLFVMLVFILIATFIRIMKIPAITWSEEIARILMIWVGLLGSGIVAREGNHFAVDVIFSHVKGKAQRIYFAFLLAANEAFAIFTIYYGIQVCIKQYNMGQLSAAMQVPMYILFLAPPLMGLSIALQAPVYFIPLITGKKQYGSELV